MRKTKSKMSSRNIAYTVSLIVIIITIALGVLLYTMTKESLKTTDVIITNKPIKQGKMITEGDISTISVGKQGLSSNIAITKSSVVGKYAMRDMMPNEYIFSTSLTDDYMKRLSEKAKYGAIAIPIDNIQAVTGDIRPDDFVGAYISVNLDKNNEQEQPEAAQGSDILPNADTALIYSKELTAIRVLGLYDQAGIEAGKGAYKVDSEGNTEVNTPSMIVFDAMPTQRTLLIQAIDNGTVRLIIHPEYIQREYRRAWGLEGSDSLDTPEDEIQEDVTEKMQEQEQIKSKHESLSENEMVNTYMGTVKSGADKEIGSDGTIHDIPNNEKNLVPTQGQSHIGVPDQNNQAQAQTTN